MKSKTSQPEKFKFRNITLPLSERVADLLARMTLEEKISQLTNEAPASPRLGVPRFVWDGECLHGICNRGRATQFPMPIGMAASFDPALLERVADAISDEARARHHDPEWQIPDDKNVLWDRNGFPVAGRSDIKNAPMVPRVGLAFYTPVINILRDPRWGRAQETYGEDPHLTSVLGAAFVRGLQGKHPKYLKVAACAKHLGVHSGPEKLRQRFDAKISRKDLAETYMPAFEALAREKVAMVMATYNRVNGEHCCASPTLIGEFMRKKFGFDGLVISDGGALGSLHTTHNMTKNAVETAAVCLRNGCDLELGSQAYPFAMKALKQGLIEEADIDRAVTRILTLRFKVGDFDPPEKVPFSRTPRSVVQCPKHIELARRIARESLVLLKNNGILPLGEKHRGILCTGPNAADAQVLLGNFYRGMSANLKTILEGVVAAAPEGTVVTHMQGCFLTHPNIFPSTWTGGLAEWSDVVIAAVGYSPLMEGEQGECIGAPEGGDKPGIAIPVNQIEFLRELKAKDKPLVAVVTGGSAMDLREIHEIADAVLLAWYPGEQGGLAVGDILFGKESPSGKLPVTFPMSLDHLPPFEEYALKGRTYRYLKDEPMYPFGFGLGYTKFKYGSVRLSSRKIKHGESLMAEVELTNAGKVKADEVAQLYLTDNEASVDAPQWALKEFQRVSLRPGQTRKLRFRITPRMMELTGKDGEPVIEPGRFTVTIGGSSPGPRSLALGAPRPATATFAMR